jgi:hypothetical protein
MQKSIDLQRFMSMESSYKMTRIKRSYKTIKNRFITEFIEKYSDKSDRHFIQVLKKWRDLEK